MYLRQKLKIEAQNSMRERQQQQALLGTIRKAYNHHLSAVVNNNNNNCMPQILKKNVAWECVSNAN